MTKILLIIPCYNEANRLKLKDFEDGKIFCQSQNIELTYLFSNDGSTDNTAEMLDHHCLKNKDIVFHSLKNLGKGNLIQEAFQQNQSTAKNFDWIGYWDADLATPISEIPRMIKFHESYADEKHFQSIWASRISRLGSEVNRQAHRHYLGRIFVTIISNIFDVKAYDSQCGAKLFTYPAMQIAMKEKFISRWIFDVEILLRLKEEVILEYPVRNWSDIPGSKVKIFKEMFRVWIDIFKIWSKHKAHT